MAKKKLAARVVKPRKPGETVIPSRTVIKWRRKIKFHWDRIEALRDSMNEVFKDTQIWDHLVIVAMNANGPNAGTLEQCRELRWLNSLQAAVNVFDEHAQTMQSQVAYIDSLLMDQEIVAEHLEKVDRGNPSNP